MAKKTDRHVIRDQNGAILGINWPAVIGGRTSAAYALPCSQDHAELIEENVYFDCDLCV